MATMPGHIGDVQAARVQVVHYVPAQSGGVWGLDQRLPAEPGRFVASGGNVGIDATTTTGKRALYTRGLGVGLID